MNVAFGNSSSGFFQKYHHSSIIHDQSSYNKEQQGALSFNMYLSPHLSATIKLVLKGYDTSWTLLGSCVWAHPEDCLRKSQLKTSLIRPLCWEAAGSQRKERSAEDSVKWERLYPIGVRPFGEPRLAVVMLTDCCSPGVAKGPQLSLKNCRSRKGKLEGKTHTHSQAGI